MGNDTINFRLATVDDAVSLEQLINATFRDDKTTQVFLSTDHAAVDVIDVPGIAAMIARPNSAPLVGIDADGAIVAYCFVREHDAARACAWFGLLAVDVRLKGRGIGGEILAYAEDYARKKLGATRMEFSVVATRAELIAWYTKRGYRPTGATTPFPYDSHPGWEGVMRGDLHFVVFGKDLGEDIGSTAAEPESVT
jgi:GNAT superfamily N-acetyltransferase